MRKVVVGLGLALGAAATIGGARAADIGVTGLKLIIVDKLAAAGKAKVVFVAKDTAITKGSGIDPADIGAALTISYDSASGAFTMSEGSNWLVNKTTVAKYVNKTAPSSGAVKVSVIKPEKLIKVVGKSLGDTPIDISAPPSGGVLVVHSVTNGAETNRHCTSFNACVHKSIAGGTGYKLVCKGSSAPAPCPGSPSGAFLD